MATILIVDDHEIVRAGVRAILSGHPDWDIHEASSGEEAIASMRELRPDVVVLDIGLPGISGLEAAPKIMEQGTGARILIFTMHQTAELEPQARRAGASGYVVKTQAVRDLVQAIERLLGGGTFFQCPNGLHEPMRGPVRGMHDHSRSTRFAVRPGRESLLRRTAPFSRSATLSS